MKVPLEYKSLRNPFLMSRKVVCEPRPPTWRTHGVVSLFIWLENRDSALGWMSVVLASLGVCLGCFVCDVGQNTVRLFSALVLTEVFAKLVLWRIHACYFKHDLPCVQLRSVAIKKDGYLMVKHYFRLVLLLSLLALWVLLYGEMVSRGDPTEAEQMQGGHHSSKWDEWRRMYVAATALDWKSLLCCYQRWVCIPAVLFGLFLQLFVESALLCLGGSKKGFGLELAWCLPVGVVTGIIVGPMALRWRPLVFILLWGVICACVRLVWFCFSLGTRVAPESEIFKQLRVVNGPGYKCDWMSSKRWEEDGQEERLSNLTWYIHKKKHRKLLAEVAYTQPEICGLPGHWFYDRKMLVEALMRLVGSSAEDSPVEDEEVDPLLAMVLDAFPRLDDFDYGKLCPGFRDMEWFHRVVRLLVGGSAKLESLAAVIVGRVAHFMGSVMLYEHQLPELPVAELASIIRALLKMVEGAENRERQENGASALLYLVLAMANYLEAESVTGAAQTHDEWLQIGLNIFCEPETVSGKTGVEVLLDAVANGASPRVKERAVGTLCALYGERGFQELFREKGGLQCMVDAAQSEGMTAMCRLSAAKILLDWGWWHGEEVADNGVEMVAVVKALANAFDLRETCFFEWEVILDILVMLCESGGLTAREMMVAEIRGEKGAVRGVVRMLEATERIISQSELLGAYQLMAENHLRNGGPLASQFAAAMDVQHVLVKALRLLLECNGTLQELVARDEHVVRVLTEVLLPAKVSSEQQALPISRLGRQWLSVAWRRLARGLPGKRRKAHHMAEVHFESLSSHWATVRQLRLWAQREVIEILAMLAVHEAEAVHAVASAALTELLEYESVEVGDSAKKWVQSVLTRLRTVGPSDVGDGGSVERHGSQSMVDEMEQRRGRVANGVVGGSRVTPSGIVDDDAFGNEDRDDGHSGETSTFKEQWGARRMVSGWAIDGRRAQRRHARPMWVVESDAVRGATGGPLDADERDGRDGADVPDGDWVEDVGLVELVDQHRNRSSSPNYDNEWELTPERSSLGREGEVSECGEDWSPSPYLRVSDAGREGTVTAGEESGDEWTQTPERIAAGIVDSIIEGR